MRQSVVLLGLAGSALMTVGLACVHEIGSAIPTMQLVGMLSMMQLLLLVSFRRFVPVGRVQWTVPLIGFSILAFAGIFCLTVAIQEGSLATAEILRLGRPFLVSILAAVFLREYLGLQTVLAMTVATFGTALVVVAEGHQLSTAWMFALLSVVFQSIANVLLRYIGNSSSPAAIVFVQLTAASLLAVPFAWSSAVLPATSDILLLLVGSGFYLAGQLLVIKTYAMDAAGVAAALSGSRAVFAILLAAIFWGQVPSNQTLAGTALLSFAFLWLWSVRKPQTDVKNDQAQPALSLGRMETQS